MDLSASTVLVAAGACQCGCTNGAAVTATGGARVNEVVCGTLNGGALAIAVGGSKELATGKNTGAEAITATGAGADGKT